MVELHWRCNLVTFEVLRTQVPSKVSGSSPSTSCSPHGPLQVEVVEVEEELVAVMSETGFWQ